MQAVARSISADCCFLSPPPAEARMPCPTSCSTPDTQVPIDSEFAKPFTERLAISKLSECETIQANSYLRFGPGIFQTRKPFSIYIFASAANIAAEFDH